MITTARQLKDLIRNLSKKKSADAQILMRNYMMERFLERISLSEYKDLFILKGGMLVAAMVGLDARATMDFDATIKGANVSLTDVETIISNIIAIPIDDGVSFCIKRISEIMEEADYPGVRVSMETKFDGVITPLKIDISTGDVITPKEIRYKYIPLLENKYIDLYAYNIETVLAEKIETILSRVELNGRIRDFYDVYLIYTKDWANVNKEHFNEALLKTFVKRDYYGNPFEAIKLIRDSELIRIRWKNYQKKYDYAKNIDFDDILDSVVIMIEEIKQEVI